MRKELIVLAICLLVSGCIATTRTIAFTPDSQRPDDESARTAVQKNDWPAAVLHLSAALRSTAPGISEKARALFTEFPATKANVLREVTEEARTKTQASIDLVFAQRHVAMILALDVYSADEKAALDKVFMESLVAAIESEGSSYNIGDIRTNGILFDREPYKSKLIEKALRKAGSPDEIYLRTQLLELYRSEPTGSPYGRRIAEALPTFKFTPSELRTGMVSQLFPDLAVSQLARSTLEVALVSTPSRRLLEADLTERLVRQMPLLSIVRSVGPKTMFEIVVRELELKETRVPVNQQTKSVPSLEIDWTLRVFSSLPSGASILYDVRHGGHRIEYGYELAVRSNGKEIEDRLVRDKVSSEYYQCSNLRYRTMGGQVRAFDIAPNADVVAWCRAGGTPVDESALKGRMLDALVSGILSLDTVRTAVAAARSGT